MPLTTKVPYYGTCPYTGEKVELSVDFQRSDVTGDTEPFYSNVGFSCTYMFQHDNDCPAHRDESVNEADFIFV